MITAANWNAASQVANEPTPQSSGSQETMTIDLDAIGDLVDSVLIVAGTHPKEGEDQNKAIIPTGNTILETHPHMNFSQIAWLMKTFG